MRQRFFRVVALLMALMLTLVMAAPLASAESLTQKKANKRPFAELPWEWDFTPTIYYTVDDVPMLLVEVEYDTKGVKGALYVELYKGSKRVFRSKVASLSKDELNWNTGVNEERAIQLLTSKGKPAVKPDTKYKLKVYVKTKYGTSKKPSYTLRTPKS